MKMRLDQVLVERSLVTTRSRARDLIKRGCVMLSGEVAQKAGQAVTPADEIAVADGANPYVSRAGLKLDAALDAFGFSADGCTALDIGASTGGFSDVLLQGGARRVYAVDVGHGQIHPTIAGDARVVNLERTDARSLTRDRVPDPIDAIVSDVSFISLTKALGPALGLAAPGCWLVALIKPQFELDPSALGKGGIVKSAADHDRAIAKVRRWLEGQPGWQILDIVDSPILGGSGNREFLMGGRREP
jgi:23S rRNA (cytidine1920-2'-O)/16S rRNA (cytidine1409-2'-O)-methyltransferase